MFVYLSLQGIEKETPLQVKVALVNVNFPYKMVIYTQFSELSLCLLFLKNNQLKILHTPNRHTLGWHKIYTHILYNSSYTSYNNSTCVISFEERKRVPDKIED